MERSHSLIQPEKSILIETWTKAVVIEAVAENQLSNVERLHFVCKRVAAMPDVHYEIDATVGVDIGVYLKG